MHMGRGPAAVDCIGLVIAVYRELGLVKEDVETDDYTMDWWEHQDTNIVFEEFKKKFKLLEVKQTLYAGDIICIRFGRAEEAHVGVLGVDNQLYHSIGGLGVVASCLDEPYKGSSWKNRISKVYRLDEKTQIKRKKRKCSHCGSVKNLRSKR